VPVSLLPSTLNLKVVSKDPFGVSIAAFHVPDTSAADAVKTNTAKRDKSHFMNVAPYQMSRIRRATYLPSVSDPPAARKGAAAT
jgi:hypothetical protein